MFSTLSLIFYTFIMSAINLLYQNWVIQKFSQRFFNILLDTFTACTGAGYFEVLSAIFPDLWLSGLWIRNFRPSLALTEGVADFVNLKI